MSFFARAEKDFQDQSKNIRSWPLQILLGSALAVLLFQVDFLYLDYLLYDLGVRYSPAVAKSEKIHILKLGRRTQEALGRLPTPQEHTKVIKSLHSAKPKLISFHVDPKHIEGSAKEKLALVNASLAIENFSLAMNATDTSTKAPPPFDQMRRSEAPTTADTAILAKDGVTRRLILEYDNHRMFHNQVAQKEGAPLTYRGQFDLLDAKQTLIRYQRPNSFPTTEFIEVLNGSAAMDLFKDKIILIGTDLKDGFKEYVETPFERELAAMPLVEMHANMLETLLSNNAPIKAPAWLTLLITIFVTVLTIHLVMISRPLFGILVLACAALAILIISYLAYWPFGVWLPVVHPLLAMFICYYFFIPYRLIVENRRSWEFYQKHKLLSQVEELKTNFISMMSHDLKTPIARIQGMSELILKEPLSTQQREALDVIKSSSVDLLSFISSILNYALIESRGVQLQLEARDLNQLIEEVVKKHEFLAKLKKIKIHTQLEPLFSIKVDPHLMRQVISNLLENAIKYSPEGAKVEIRSSEVESRVRIEVVDNGPGIPNDEIANVFMKFFRSKNVKTSTIKGSGLGLYLAKYFVQLHKGDIYVTSQPGQGSVFTVELPLEGT